MANKICADCKHHYLEGAPPWGNPACHAPQNEDTRVRAEDLISRRTEKRYRWSYCTLHREDGWLSARVIKTCGREGRWFEPKEPTR